MDDVPEIPQHLYLDVDRPPIVLPDPMAPRHDSWGMFTVMPGQTETLHTEVDRFVTEIRIAVVEPQRPTARNRCRVTLQPAGGGQECVLCDGTIRATMTLSAALPMHLHGTVSVAISVDSGEKPVTSVVTAIYVPPTAR